MPRSEPKPKEVKAEVPSPYVEPEPPSEPEIDAFMAAVDPPNDDETLSTAFTEQLAARDRRIAELEGELAVARSHEKAAKQQLRDELDRRRDTIPKVPATEVQRANNERRRRRELATMDGSRLVSLLKRTDGRTEFELRKLGRPQLIDLIIHGERMKAGANI